MKKPSHDPSVSQEPHLQGSDFETDASEKKVQQKQESSPRSNPSEDEQVEHTVWDEPGLSKELTGETPAGELTYRSWLEKRHQQTRESTTWLVTIGLALLAGPWAILGALLNPMITGGHTAMGIGAIVLFGPVVEEMLKAGTALILIEKRPFLFRSPIQILICVLAGAGVFAVIENVLYLYVYVPDPPEGLFQWRWSICVLLHMGCTLIAGMGLIRMWKDVWRRRGRPRISIAFPYLVVAMVVHGSYNTFAVILNFMDFHF